MVVGALLLVGSCQREHRDQHAGFGAVCPHESSVLFLRSLMSLMSLILHQNIPNHIAMHVGQASLDTVVIKGQPLVVEAKQVQYRGVEIIDR